MLKSGRRWCMSALAIYEYRFKNEEEAAALSSPIQANLSRPPARRRRGLPFLHQPP